MKCPHKNSSKKNLEGAAGEALASNLKIYFTLIAFMLSIMMRCVWYLDSSASFHMTECTKFFSDVEEKDLQMHIEMGDDKRYNVTRIGIVNF